jgi:hypothetical protein
MARGLKARLGLDQSWGLLQPDIPLRITALTLHQMALSRDPARGTGPLLSKMGTESDHFCTKVGSVS